MRVTEVWFLKKKDKGDKFEDFHYDYKNSGGGSNYVSFTVNVNLGKLNEANDIATMNNISPSNEEPSVLPRSRRELCWQSWMLACPNKGQNDRQVSVRPMCCRHVGRHVGNTT